MSRLTPDGNMERLILLPIILITFVSFGQERINMTILRNGQKIFIERGDYMNDKIYAITEKTDTVQVILADQAFYKFRKDGFEAWAITAQLNPESDILPNKSFVTFPFNVRTDRETLVYKDGKMGADKMLDLKKGVDIKVKAKVGLFYEIEFNTNKTGYIVTTVVPGPERTSNQSHIMRSIFEQINNRSPGGTDERYVRSSGKFISKYSTEGYSSETYRIDNTLYTITKYGGKTEISTYTTY